MHTVSDKQKMPFWLSVSEPATMTAARRQLAPLRQRLPMLFQNGRFEELLQAE